MQYCKCYYVNTKRFRHFSCLRSIQWCPKQTVYKKITSIDPAVLISIWYQYQLHCDSRNRPRTRHWYYHLRLNQLCLSLSSPCQCEYVLGVLWLSLCKHRWCWQGIHLFYSQAAATVPSGQSVYLDKTLRAITPIGTLRDVVVMFEIKLCKKKMSGSSYPVVLIWMRRLFFIVRPFINIRLD